MSSPAIRRSCKPPASRWWPVSTRSASEAPTPTCCCKSTSPRRSPRTPKPARPHRRCSYRRAPTPLCARWPAVTRNCSRPRRPKASTTSPMQPRTAASAWKNGWPSRRDRSSGPRRRWRSSRKARRPRVWSPRRPCRPPAASPSSTRAMARSGRAWAVRCWPTRRASPTSWRCLTPRFTPTPAFRSSMNCATATPRGSKTPPSRSRCCSPCRWR